MNIWTSKTKLWGSKTRPVNLKNAVKKIADGEHKEIESEEYKDDYLEEEDKIKALEAEVSSLKDRLSDKCGEISGLQKQLHENTMFMQTVILELIQLKNTPQIGLSAPKSRLEEYIANKNARSSGELKGKLP